MNDGNIQENQDLNVVLLKEYDQASVYARWNLEKMYNLFNNYIMILTAFITILISIVKFYFAQDVALSLIFLTSSILVSITFAVEKHLYRLYTRFLDFVIMMICIRRKLGITRHLMYPKEFDWLLVNCKDPYDENIPYKCKVMVIDKDHTLYNLRLIFSVLKFSLYTILFITLASVLLRNSLYLWQIGVVIRSFYYINEITVGVIPSLMKLIANDFLPLIIGSSILFYSLWKTYIPVKEFERECNRLFNQYKVEVANNSVVDKIKNMQLKDALTARRLLDNLSVVFRFSPFPVSEDVEIDQIPTVEDWGHATIAGIGDPFYYAIHIGRFTIYYAVDEQNKVVKILDINIQSE